MENHTNKYALYSMTHIFFKKLYTCISKENQFFKRGLQKIL